MMTMPCQTTLSEGAGKDPKIDVKNLDVTLVIIVALIHITGLRARWRCGRVMPMTNERNYIGEVILYVDFKLNDNNKNVRQ